MTNLPATSPLPGYLIERYRSWHAGRFADTLVALNGGGITIVLIEHDMGVVFGLADRISVLVYGEIIATGAPEAVRANPKVQEAYLGAALETEH